MTSLTTLIFDFHLVISALYAFAYDSETNFVISENQPLHTLLCVMTGPEQLMKIDDRKINQSINDNRLIIVD